MSRWNLASVRRPGGNASTRHSKHTPSNYSSRAINALAVTSILPLLRKDPLPSREWRCHNVLQILSWKFGRMPGCLSRLRQELYKFSGEAIELNSLACGVPSHGSAVSTLLSYDVHRSAAYRPAGMHLGHNLSLSWPTIFDRIEI